MKFRIEHTFYGIELADYERLYFAETFNDALCAKVDLGRDVQKREMNDGLLQRVVKVSPNREIPAAAAKVLGTNKIEYTEYVDYKMGSFEGTWKTISSIMTEKVDSRGRFGFKSVPGGVLRWVDGEIKVKILGFGGVVEKFIVADVEKSYEKAAEFTASYIKNESSVA